MMRLKGMTIALALVVVSALSVAPFIYQSQTIEREPESEIAVAKEDDKPEDIILEVHIANNGLILLRGAKVIKTLEESIIVVTKWDTLSFEWEVKLDSMTQFIKKDGKKAKLVDLKEGDFVVITGKMLDSETKPSINAQYIRFLTN